MSNDHDYLLNVLKPFVEGPPKHIHKPYAVLSNGQVQCFCNWCHGDRIFTEKEWEEEK